MTDDDRLMDLEVKVAYLEKLVAELDGVVREQATLMGRLAASLERATLQGDAAPIIDERPPHY